MRLLVLATVTMTFIGVQISNWMSGAPNAGSLPTFGTSVPMVVLYEECPKEAFC